MLRVADFLEHRSEQNLALLALDLNGTSQIPQTKSLSGITVLSFVSAEVAPAQAYEQNRLRNLSLEARPKSGFPHASQRRPKDHGALFLFWDFDQGITYLSRSLTGGTQNSADALIAPDGEPVPTSHR